MINSLAGTQLFVGGNYAQFTQDGKVKITDPNGKTKIISQKSFEKQVEKNVDKPIFEFKSNNTAKNVVTGAGVLAAVTAAVVYRKNIGQLIKKLRPGVEKFHNNYNKTVKNKASGLYDKLPKCVKEFGIKAKKYYNKVQPEATEKLTNVKQGVKEMLHSKKITKIKENLNSVQTKAKKYYEKVQPEVSQKTQDFKKAFEKKINIKNNEDRSISGLYEKYVKGLFESLKNFFKKYV